ncbi:hypothetical protein TanjilG_30973 [Lupinus angustifolius]|uniref:Uncharacterized protein n=1 Tax=Lupinus angustifolius TaxID=3871 RepID=A0A1J7HMF2_LUPAN|nr:hypothetical protein TanjilG_30973 [Lupinus angustifolius]
MSKEELETIWLRICYVALEVIIIGHGQKFASENIMIMKSSFNDLNSLWHPPSTGSIKFFSPKDLWDCYYEWSAYGVGAPVMLENGVRVVQYYVPYLSAIQIYTNKSVAASRNRKEDSDGVEFESDLWSDESGSDKLSRSLSDTSSKACIPELAKSYPTLMTFKSVDLSPASWMAVSWYPIYTIPSRKNDKDLEVGFLTYHTLSSSFEGNVVFPK